MDINIVAKSCKYCRAYSVNGLTIERLTETTYLCSMETLRDRLSRRRGRCVRCNYIRKCSSVLMLSEVMSMMDLNRLFENMDHTRFKNFMGTYGH